MRKATKSEPKEDTISLLVEAVKQTTNAVGSKNKNDTVLPSTDTSSVKNNKKIIVS